MSETKFTSFKIVKTKQEDKSSDDLQEPVLVSFPQSMPEKAQLNEMQFSLYES